MKTAHPHHAPGASAAQPHDLPPSGAGSMSASRNRAVIKPRHRQAALAAAVALAWGTPAWALDHVWTSGTWAANGLPNPLPAADTVFASGAGDKTFTGLVTNQGTISWQTAATAWLSGSGTVLRNEGLFDLWADARIASANNLGERFENAGVLRKSAGSGVSAIDAFFVNRSGGVMDAASGTLAYQRNSSFEAGSLFTGAGTHRLDSGGIGAATYTFHESVRNAAGALQFVAGNYTSGGSTATLLEGGVQWSGGDFRGRWRLNAGDTVQALAGGVKGVVGELVNDGTLLWSTANSLVLYGTGTVLRNNGTFELRDNATIVLGGNFGETFDNAGLLRKAGTAGQATITARLINRSGGVLDVAAGSTLAYSNSSTFEAGSLFSGAGTHRLDSGGIGAATYTFHESVRNAAGALQFVAGNYTSGGSTATLLEGGVQWSGGDFRGRWQLKAGDTVQALAGGAKGVVGELVNDGTMVWSTANNLVLYGSGTVLRNNGTFELRDNAGIVLGGNFGETFDNRGLLSKSGGDGTSTISPRLSNTGIIEVTSGTLALPAGFFNEGVMRGTATFAATTLDNRGTVSPGLSDGDDRIAVLSLSGALEQSAAAVFEVDVGSGGISDLLAVSGAVAFDGTVHVHGVDGYVAQVGDTFRVMTFAGFSGQLLDVVEYGFGNGVQFAAIYSPTYLELQVVAVPEPGTYALWLAGLGALGAMARRRSTAART